MLEKVKYLLDNEDKLNALEATLDHLLHLAIRVKIIYAKLLDNEPLTEEEEQIIEIAYESSHRVETTKTMPYLTWKMETIDGEDTLIAYTTYKTWLGEDKLPLDNGAEV